MLLLHSKGLLDLIVYDCKFVSTGAAVHFNRLKGSKQRKKNTITLYIKVLFIWIHESCIGFVGS